MEKTIEINGVKEYYADIITHITNTTKFSFRERLAILFGKSLKVTSLIYCKSSAIPCFSTAQAEIEPIFNKHKLKQYFMKNQDENPVSDQPEVTTEPTVTESVEPKPTTDLATDPGSEVGNESLSEPEVANKQPEKDWYDRLVIEEKELADKVALLKPALDGKKVPVSQEHILTMQLNAMLTYQQILQTRIKLGR